VWGLRSHTQLQALCNLETRCSRIGDLGSFGHHWGYYYRFDFWYGRLPHWSMSDSFGNVWGDALHAVQYLDRAGTIPHRMEGESALLEWPPKRLARVLDLGSGDGRLLSIVTHACAPAEAVVLDFSETMLERLRGRFAANPAIRIVTHD